MNTTTKVANIPVWQNQSLVNLKNETWKEVPNYKGAYFASSLGRVKSVDRLISCHKKYKRFSKGTILSCSKKKNGYLGVTLFLNGKRNYISIHRIIALTFLDNPKNLPQVNHLNGNKLDNSINNLEWSSISNNIKHSFKELNRPKPIGMKGKRGRLCNTSKKVNQLDLNGNIIKTWDGINEASRNGFGAGNIFSCCIGKRKTHKGFKWEYFDMVELEKTA